MEASEIISVDGGKDGDALYLRAENRLANIQKGETNNGVREHRAEMSTSDKGVNKKRKENHH